MPFLQSRVREPRIHWPTSGSDRLTQDLRFALRTLRKSPAFSIAAIGTLALGIGATTVIFSIVSGVLLRPLPFADPNRLVQLTETSPRNDAGPVIYPDLEVWRNQSTSFEAMVAYTSVSRNLQNVADPEQVATVAAERGLFHTLGVEPIAGRTFVADDPPQVVVISEGFWKRHFGADPSAVGRKITFDGEGFTVIGVMPDRFQFPYRATYTDAWIPWEAPAQFRKMRTYRADFVVARVKPGIPMDGALTELNGIAQRLEIEYPETNRGRRARITPLSEVVAGKVRDSLLVLFGAVGMVLLVACVNVANLLLARAATRTREVAIRAALGAQRSRLVFQFLTESILLAVGGGLAGLAIASWGGSLLLKLAASDIPRSSEVTLDWRVFTFLLATCVVTGIGFGLAPAMGASRVDFQSALRQSGGRGTAAASRFRGALTTDGLVVVEIAAAFVLLIGAGLLLRTFFSLRNTQTGLQAENVLTLHLTIPATQPQTPGAGAQYCREIEERVQRIPGVRAVGLVSLLPLQDWGWTARISVPGRPGHAAAPMFAELRYVSPGYFRALGIPIRKGRGFTDFDRADSAPVILINDALARQYFPNQDPIGRRIDDRGAVVGIVGDVRQSGLDRPPAPEIYYPIAQNFAQRPDAGMSLVVSAMLPPQSLARSVVGAIRLVNPNQAVFHIKTMQRVIADSLSNRSLYLWLLGVFAGIALALAVAGIYGVVSYAVASRTKEFAVRLALGADAGGVLRIVLGHGALLIGIGLAIGLTAAAGLTRLLQALLFGVSPMDPETLVVVAALLTAVALAACLIPAQRAMRLDPAIALRYE
jgi:putative ABC transport system permease protein